MQWAKQKQLGFTIVELLIVIVVIAILAAITIVAYNGIQNRAKQSAAQSRLSQANKKILAYAVQNSDTYPDSLAQAEIDNSDNALQYTVNNTSSPKTYGLTATSGTFSYFVTSTNSTPVAGGYQGHGQNGVSAITNLVNNPGLAVDLSGTYSNWGGNGGGVSSMSRQPASWATRGFAARSTWTTANTTYNGDLGWVAPATTSPAALKPNTQYAVRWKLRTSKAMRIQVQVGNWSLLNGSTGSGTGTVGATSGIIVTAPNTTAEQWALFTTGANTYGAKMFSGSTSGTNAALWNVGDYIEISDLILIEGNTVPNYADGASTDWVWNGNPGVSTSTGPSL